MANQKPTFMLADVTGRTQFALVDGTLGEACNQAVETARLFRQKVIVYSMTHIATYAPPQPVQKS